MTLTRKRDRGKRTEKYHVVHHHYPIIVAGMSIVLRDFNKFLLGVLRGFSFIVVAVVIFFFFLSYFWEAFVAEGERNIDVSFLNLQNGITEV